MRGGIHDADHEDAQNHRREKQPRDNAVRNTPEPWPLHHDHIAVDVEMLGVSQGTDQRKKNDTAYAAKESCEWTPKRPGALPRFYETFPQAGTTLFFSGFPSFPIRPTHVAVYFIIQFVVLGHVTSPSGAGLSERLSSDSDARLTNLRAHPLLRFAPRLISNLDE